MAAAAEVNEVVTLEDMADDEGQSSCWGLGKKLYQKTKRSEGAMQNNRCWGIPAHICFALYAHRVLLTKHSYIIHYQAAQPLGLQRFILQSDLLRFLQICLANAQVVTCLIIGLLVRLLMLSY